MFTTEERDAVREGVLEMARSDPRVTAGALTGSISLGNVDEWSDIDIAFGVVGGTNLEAILDEWTAVLERELGMVHCWDLPFRSSLYRVFLLPSGLEIDVAVVPEEEFGPRGPSFRTLFGTAHPQEPPPKPSTRFITGLGWHHVFHARSGIERGKPWLAQHWISAVREQTFALACLRFGEIASEARGVDRLPAAVTRPLQDALVRSLDEAELRRALAAATTCFISELEATDPEVCARLKPLLEERGMTHQTSSTQAG